MWLALCGVSIGIHALKRASRLSSSVPNEEISMPQQAQFPTAEAFLPKLVSLPALQEAAHDCRGCDLYKRGTQTVFGEGPKAARVMFVGEQPGDQEDKAGKPFVGPAGMMLDRALEKAGIDRSEVYVTNA